MTMRNNERLIQRHSGAGRLIFENGEATITYEIDEFLSDGSVRKWQGRVSHAKGHPAWNLILAHHPRGPYTLVMDDGRKLKVFFRNLQGSIEGTGELF